MNAEIELQLKNAHIVCLQIFAITEYVNIEDKMSDTLIVGVLNNFYSKINDRIISEYSFEQFKFDLSELFEKKKPARPLACVSLENWLSTSQRNKQEHRFKCYLNMLVKQGKGNIVTQLEADTFSILDKCHNPLELGLEWDRRGLVYGNVQSGKTANYIGLINRAFDAGYQIVIVFTGMTEDLRSQTQRRVDDGVVGQRGQERLGIGREPSFETLEPIRPATTLFDDLSKRNSDILASLISTNEKSIWVVKKNKTVLENLIFWLDRQRNNGNRIHGVPILVIDDEADNASIQSFSKKEFEIWGEGQRISDLESGYLTEEEEIALAEAQNRIIKAINRNIRVALSLMSHKTFVAYTATPYNIINQSERDLQRSVIIDNKEFTIDANSDLFPEHFIIPITAGRNYLGIENIFHPEAGKSLPVLVNLTEKYVNEDLENDYFPSNRGESYIFNDLPKSLEDSILHFVLSIIIRKYRGQNDYNTLLIHTSHLTDNADYVAVKVEMFLKKLCDNIPGNNGGYMDRIQDMFIDLMDNSKNEIFQSYFGKDYSFPLEITKQNVLDVLLSKMNADHEYVFAPLDVVSYHSSKSTHLKHRNWTLDYNLSDNNGKRRYKNYIVVGGNRLSRGLTLEGLTTSYFVRNSTRQDSLYQMARWFGYRDYYEDLVRIFLPEDQIIWFQSIYKLEKELRKDFIDNNEDEDFILPKDAVIKMAYHTPEDMYLPDRVHKRLPTICDPNKMRNTSRQLMTKSGTTKTNRIINDELVQNLNIAVVRTLFDSVINDGHAQLFDPRESALDLIRNNTNCNYTSVDVRYILELLENYQGDIKIKHELDSLRLFILKNNVELGKWSLALVNRGVSIPTQFYGSFYRSGELINNGEIRVVERHQSAKIEGDSLEFKSILDSSKDNLFDVLNDGNIDEFNNSKPSDFIKKYRNKLKKPLLLVYLATCDKSDIPYFPLLYFFVPVLDNAEKVTYVVRNR